jgi:WD40 repeat protein
VTCLAFDPRGSMLATGATNGGITLWNVADGATRQTFRQGRGWVRGLAFSKDGSSVTWVLSSGSVFTADVATGQTGESPQNSSRGRSPRALALAPDGAMLAVAIDPSAVELREATTGQLRRTLHGSRSLALELAFSADGSTLAAGRPSQDVDVWDVATGESRQGPPRSPRRPTSPNERLALSPDGRRLAWLDRDRTLAVWDEKTAQVRHVPLGRSRGGSPSGAGTPLAFCPDGSTLVLGTRSLEFCNPLLGEVWPVSDRSTVPIASLAVSPDGSLVATGHADGSTTLWDVTWSDLPDADDAEPDEHEIPPEPPAPAAAKPIGEGASSEPEDPFAAPAAKAASPIDSSDPFAAPPPKGGKSSDSPDPFAP